MPNTTQEAAEKKFRYFPNEHSAYSISFGDAEKKIVIESIMSQKHAQTVVELLNSEFAAVRNQERERCAPKLEWKNGNKLLLNGLEIGGVMPTNEHYRSFTPFINGKGWGFSGTLYEAQRSAEEKILAALRKEH